MGNCCSDLNLGKFWAKQTLDFDTPLDIDIEDPMINKNWKEIYDLKRRCWGIQDDHFSSNSFIESQKRYLDCKMTFVKTINLNFDNKLEPGRIVNITFPKFSILDRIVFRNLKISSPKYEQYIKSIGFNMGGISIDKIPGDLCPVLRKLNGISNSCKIPFFFSKDGYYLPNLLYSVPILNVELKEETCDPYELCDPSSFCDLSELRFTVDIFEIEYPDKITHLLFSGDMFDDSRLEMMFTQVQHTPLYDAKGHRVIYNYFKNTITHFLVQSDLPLKEIKLFFENHNNQAYQLVISDFEICNGYYIVKLTPSLDFDKIIGINFSIPHIIKLEFDDNKPDKINEPASGFKDPKYRVYGINLNCFCFSAGIGGTLFL